VLLCATSQNAWGQSELLKPYWLPGGSPASTVNLADIDTAPVKLDGYQLFLLAAPAVSQRFPLEQRVRGIEEELNLFANSNVEPDAFRVTANLDHQSGLPVISIDGRYLMTVTTLDAQLQGRDPQGWASQLSQTLRNALVRARQERQPSFLRDRGLVSGGIILGMILVGRIFTYWQKRLKVRQEAIEAQIDRELTLPLDSVAVDNLQQQMSQRQQMSVSDLQGWCLKLGHLGIWGGGSLMILGLFPYTRWLQSFLLSSPLQVLAIGLGTYLLIRISDVLIDRFSVLLKAKDFSALKASQRLKLRVSTVSQALKNVTTIVWIGLGTLASLSVVGVDLIPLLAGAGIIGLAISFAAQGLIKDVINGFLILLEDQYAVGDVIVVGELGGLVENMNLRITQVRNNEGRLITIPNSAIAIVQNLSKDWARVDLTIEVSYDTDPDRALAVLQQVAQDIYSDHTWRTKILEPPEVLGIDGLQHSGLLIRIWIKTQPLQQWVVAREFRRRLKLAMEQEGIAIGVPHQSFWLESSLNLNANSLEAKTGGA
jgi:small conductance mechanosensitive channel